MTVCLVIIITIFGFLYSGKPNKRSNFPEEIGKSTTTTPDVVTKPTSSPPKSGLANISKNRLRVTLGKISTSPSGILSISDPEVRAMVEGGKPQKIAMSFTYLGPTEKTEPLASGRIRRQLGLKMAQENSCNRISIMWHAYPATRIQIQTKENPGKETSSECGASGYSTVANIIKNVPALKLGSSHKLETELIGRQLTVYIDDKKIWSGSVPAKTLKFNGQVGVRTDNVRMTFRVFN